MVPPKQHHQNFDRMKMKLTPTLAIFLRNLNNNLTRWRDCLSTGLGMPQWMI